MSFSIASLFNLCTTKSKKFSIRFRSRFLGGILNTSPPIHATVRRPVLEFCLGHPSIKNLFSTGFILFSNAEPKLQSTILSNLVPLIGPKYCSHRSTPFLNEMSTVKFEFIDPCFFPLVVQLQDNPSDFIHHSLALGTIACFLGFCLYWNPFPSM